LKELDQKRNEVVKDYGQNRRERIAEGKQVAKLGRGFGKRDPSKHSQDWQDHLDTVNPIYSSEEFGFGRDMTNREVRDWKRENNFGSSEHRGTGYFTRGEDIFDDPDYTWSNKR
jgi:hypothetical protein